MATQERRRLCGPVFSGVIRTTMRLAGVTQAAERTRRELVFRANGIVADAQAPIADT